jgi:peptidoglycan/LPS O-acetylase OafA/YrhL
MAYTAFALAIGVAYLCVAVFFWSRYANDESKPIPLWWYLVVGPIAFLASHRRRRTASLSSREAVGWLAVVLLMLVIIVWKLFLSR